MREIRTLRAMWRVLETEPRQFLSGHEEGNLGYMPRRSLRVTAPVPDPTTERNHQGKVMFSSSRRKGLASKSPEAEYGLLKYYSYAA